MGSISCRWGLAQADRAASAGMIAGSLGVTADVAANSAALCTSSSV